MGFYQQYDHRILQAARDFYRYGDRVRCVVHYQIKIVTCIFGHPHKTLIYGNSDYGTPHELILWHSMYGFACNYTNRGRYPHVIKTTDNIGGFGKVDSGWMRF